MHHVRLGRVVTLRRDADRPSDRVLHVSARAGDAPRGSRPGTRSCTASSSTSGTSTSSTISSSCGPPCVSAASCGVRATCG
jgi:hypothetical protein